MCNLPWLDRISEWGVAQGLGIVLSDREAQAFRMRAKYQS